MRRHSDDEQNMWRDLLNGASGTTVRVAESYPPTFRRQARAGVGRDRPPRRARRRCNAPVRDRPFNRHVRTASSRTRPWPNELAARFFMARGFDTIAHAWSAGGAALAIFAGARPERCGNSNSFIRISATHQSLHLPPPPLARPLSSWMSGRCSRPRRRCRARSFSASSSKRS